MLNRITTQEMPDDSVIGSVDLEGFEEVRWRASVDRGIGQILIKKTSPLDSVEKADATKTVECYRRAPVTSLEYRDVIKANLICQILTDLGAVVGSSTEERAMSTEHAYTMHMPSVEAQPNGITWVGGPNAEPQQGESFNVSYQHQMTTANPMQIVQGSTLEEEQEADDKVLKSKEQGIMLNWIKKCKSILGS